MKIFGIGWSSVDKTVNPGKVNRIPVKGNENRMVRVAFDLFKLNGGDSEELWQVQADDDGNEYLCRAYDFAEEQTKSASNWAVEIDKKCANISIYHKGTPIKRIAAKDCGITVPEDVIILRDVILEKLASDSEFAKDLLMVKRSFNEKNEGFFATKEQPKEKKKAQLKTMNDIELLASLTDYNVEDIKNMCKEAIRTKINTLGLFPILDGEFVEIIPPAYGHSEYPSLSEVVFSDISEDVEI